MPIIVYLGVTWAMELLGVAAARGLLLPAGATLAAFLAWRDVLRHLGL